MEKHHIFPTTIYTSRVNLNMTPMIEYLYKEKQVDKGVNLSNRGGWQSQDNLNLQPQFTPLVNYIQDIFKKSHNFKINMSHMWGNISSKYHYNVIHSHGRVFNMMSGVYYLQTNQYSGCLTLHNEGNVDISKNFYPKPGVLIFFPSSVPHSVGINLSDEDRISIAFNFQTNQTNG